MFTKTAREGWLPAARQKPMGWWPFRLIGNGSSCPRKQRRNRPSRSPNLSDLKESDYPFIDLPVKIILRWLLE